ncbi:MULTISPECIES: protein kinase family protein [Enterococcus]|uniref:Protein kinase domain-containing protein n=1 Tax=Candidatus Enterococcus ferrettii TaxID=2815324 RepID=A0ABV0ENS1_9ENTE|nr:protein kinase family protein [Enterococcus sp. 665A]MBO1341413.1 protein kinase family protein [Enterococcus sp. 665A]
MENRFEIRNLIDTKLQIEKIKDLSSDTEGKNSTVFLGRDPQMDKDFLIKKISKTNLRMSTKDIFEETKVLTMSGHRNIMPIQYATQDEEYIYMALPYYQRGSLNKMANDYESNIQLIGYCLDFLSGLAHAHVLKILHLDIKPSNIIIDDSDRAILTDFGQSCKLPDDDCVPQEKSIYSANISPTLLETGLVSFQDDIYQVGLTLYRMFNNFYYEESINSISSQYDLQTKILNKTFPKNQFLPHIPKQLQRIINKCLMRDTVLYSSIIEVMNDIAKLDQMLDVGFRKNKNNNHLEWKKVTETAIINIEMDEFTNEVVAFKQNKISGNSQKISTLNKSFESQKDALGAIKKYL